MLFDSDGVLVDSKDSGTRAWVSWSKQYGLDPGRGAGQHARQAIDRHGFAVLARAGPGSGGGGDRRAGNRGRRSDPAHSGCSGAAPRAAGRLGGDHVRDQAAAAARFAAAGLELPEVVVVTSADVSAGKPAPDGYLFAAQRLGVPIAECVVVEDSLNAIEAGRTAGRFRSASVTTRWSPTPRRSCWVPAEAAVNSTRHAARPLEGYSPRSLNPG